jgi:hypothetical protein
MKGYLHQLKRTLTGKGGLSNKHADEVVADVAARMTSMLSFWPDRPYRDTLLFMGREEAEFYEPRQAPIMVRSFVVMGLRNSLIGDHLNHHSTVNSDAIMYQFTLEAITYFAQRDLAALAEQVLEDHGRGQGIFAGLDTSCPAAWSALSHLAGLTPRKRHKVYAPVPTRPPVDLISADIDTEFSSGGVAIWPEMEISPSPQLNCALLKIQRPELAGLVVDSFKFLTRNLHGLCRVLEFILAADSYFCTINYFITNGYVSRRRSLLRPAHTTEEVVSKVLDQTARRRDITQAHYDALQDARRGM